MTANEITIILRGLLSSDTESSNREAATRGWLSDEQLAHEYLDGHLGEDWRQLYPMNEPALAEFIWWSLEERSRALDGSRYVCCRDDTPELVRSLVSDICQGDDWRYRFVKQSAGEFGDMDPDEWEEAADDVDVSPSIYNSELCEWLSAGRAHYVDQAVEDGLSSPDGGVIGMIAGGQWVERQEVAYGLRLALEEMVEGVRLIHQLIESEEIVTGGGGCYRTTVEALEGHLRSG